MRIFVFSDSHGYTAPMENVLKTNLNTCDTVIHLGDCSTDIPAIDRIIGVKPLIYVAGNNGNTLSLFAPSVPESKQIELCGKNFYICHGHRLGVKSSYDMLFATGQKYGCDIVLFGHTHVPWKETRGGITIFNPGSIGVPSHRGYTYGIITLNDGEQPEFEIKAVNI